MFCGEEAEGSQEVGFYQIQGFIINNFLLLSLVGRTRCQDQFHVHLRKPQAAESSIECRACELLIFVHTNCTALPPPPHPPLLLASSVLSINNPSFLNLDHILPSTHIAHLSRFRVTFLPRPPSHSKRDSQ